MTGTNSCGIFFPLNTLKTVILACVYTQVHTDGTDMHSNNVEMFVCWKHITVGSETPFRLGKLDDRNKNGTPAFSKHLRIKLKNQSPISRKLKCLYLKIIPGLLLLTMIG